MEVIGGYDEKLPCYQDRDLDIRLHNTGGGARSDGTFVFIVNRPGHETITSGNRDPKLRESVLRSVLQKSRIEMPRVAYIALDSHNVYNPALPTLRYRAGDVFGDHVNSSLITDLEMLEAEWRDVDVLIFTKPTTTELVGWAAKAREMGKIIVFDWTTGLGINVGGQEVGFMFDWWCKTADVCIGATDAITKAMEKRGCRHIAMIPDCMQMGLCANAKTDYSWNRVLCWHGFSGNLASLLAISPVLWKTYLKHQTVVRLVLEGSYPRDIQWPFPVEVVEWTPGAEKSTIRDSDLVIDATLDGGCFPYKSDGKLMLSWALKVPAIRLPANSPAWERRLEKLIGDKNAREKSAFEGWKYVAKNRTHKHFIKAMMEVIDRCTQDRQSK